MNIDKSKEGTVLSAHYICHRTGTRPDVKLNRCRASKKNSTIKIGTKCPSRIILKYKEGKYQVNWISNHVGHECNSSARVPRITRQLIANYLKIGVTPIKIKQKLRTMSNYNCDSSELRSSLLINIKDIYNIKKQYKIEDLADQDHRVFIKSMMSIVLDYKEIGEARSDFHTDDFFIIIMSESQQRMMINNSDIISMDSTHDSSIKGLLLTTIMCRDKKQLV